MYLKKYFIFLLYLSLFAGCAKQPFAIDPLQPDPYTKSSQSSTRLLNFAYSIDLTFNGTMITSGHSSLININGLVDKPAIPYFPSDGIWHRSPGTLGPVASGNPFGIPDEFIGPDGSVDIKLNFTKSYRGVKTATSPTYVRDSIQFTEHIDAAQPKDIFLYLDDLSNTRQPFRAGWNYNTTGQEITTDYAPFDVVKAEVPKNLSKPANPQNFKIRIVNLASLSDIGVKFTNGDRYNNLSGSGAVTLTFADGTPVNEQLTNILPAAAGGQFVSDYVELTYGTYMFRVQDASSSEGVFLPQKIFIPITSAGTEHGIMSVNANTYPYGAFSAYITPSVFVSVLGSSNVLANMADAYKYKGCLDQIPTTRTQFFEPGGIYTIVVSAKPFGGSILGNPWPYYANSYEIVQDNSSAKNYNYGQIQFINVMPGATDVTAKVGGVDYGELNDYSDDPANPKNFNSLRTRANFKPFQVGAYPVSILSGGTELVAGTLTLEPNEALTIWIYPDASGNPKILSRNVDLSYTRLINPERNTPNTRADDIMGYFATDLYALNLSQDVRAVRLANVGGIQPDGTIPNIFLNTYTRVDSAGLFYQGVVTGKLGSSGTSPTGLLSSNSFSNDVRVYDTSGPVLSELKAARFKFNEYLAVNYNAVKYMPKISVLLNTPSQPEYNNQPSGYFEHGVFSLVIIGSKANGTLKSIVVNHIK
jgi:hypothetical protein